METRVEVVADDGNLCGEGPHWDEREQALWWTDIDGKKFYRYDWRKRRHELVSEGFTVNGFALQQDGGLVTTSSQGAWLWTPGQEPFLLASEADGQELRLNDCAADAEGRVYSGSYHLDEKGESEPSYLFRIDNDGTAHVVDEGIKFSNGLAFSPDGGTLYFTDMAARCIYAYDWRRSDGALSRRRVFVRVERGEGMPDGLTVDAEGFLWVAHWFGGCVTRYDPDGKRERKVELPAKQTSSMVFGGPELDELYVTTAAMNNCLMLAPEGYDPGKGLVGGALYRVRPGVRGKLKYRARIS